MQMSYLEQFAQFFPCTIFLHYGIIFLCSSEILLKKQDRQNIYNTGLSCLCCILHQMSNEHVKQHKTQKNAQKYVFPWTVVVSQMRQLAYIEAGTYLFSVYHRINIKAVKDWAYQWCMSFDEQYSICVVKQLFSAQTLKLKGVGGPWYHSLSETHICSYVDLSNRLPLAVRTARICCETESAIH